MVRWNSNGAGDPKRLRRLERTLDFELPASYREFMLDNNGGEGDVGFGPGRIRMWSLEEHLRGVDGGIAVEGFFIFGSNEAGIAYGFNGAHEVITMTASGIMLVIAPDFEAFAAELGRSVGGGA